MSDEKNTPLQRQAEPELVSRRHLLRRSATAVGGATAAALVLGAGGARAQSGKISQEAAGYQDTPKADQRCDNCALFEPPSSCRFVADPIAPEGWCKLYQR